MNSSTMSGEVRDYVAGVREALSDLPVEDVEEFTTGMEADLAERLAEPGDGTLRDRLGVPEAYAAELRSAAGLPPRLVGPEAKKSVGQRFSEQWDRMAAQVLGALPWLRDLRPVWWAVRGFALAAIPATVLGVGIVWLGILGVIVSVALGLLARHGKVVGHWVRPVRFVVNGAAVLALPVALVLLADGPVRNDTYYGEPGPISGVTSNGNQVTNLYAFDETGRRLDKVRLYDQTGQQLVIDPMVYDYTLSQTSPSEYEQLWDPTKSRIDIESGVFPVRWLNRTGWEPFEEGEWEPPMAITPLPGPVPTVEASPTPSSTVTSTASPTPSTSPQPSASASPGATQTSPGSGAAATPTPTATSR
ncbi:hypothetical protein [Knoellia subterranea]|uniref:Uncharacterized protein n=1 Tax=Knoellia subterranea KCTC 19937 TaxID=1385521 RepID=A0A0A0JPQ0_9MICO|nr:hypothetical protein [Knoellia subterranea]KGN37561.1 hypothetical protein N803_13370 [Knoellia subterranea KCTC 19937]